MSTVKMEESQLLEWVDKLIALQRVIGVQEKQDHFVYDTLRSASDLRLDHDVTYLPPVKFLFPQREQLIDFKLDEGYESRIESEPFVLLGVHPYDVVAISQMDAIYSTGHEDQHYMSRRRNATIIACDVETPSKNTFAGYMGTATVKEGFDVLLTRIESEYIAEAGSEKGEALLTLVSEGVTSATADHLARREEVWRNNVDKMKQQELKVDPRDWPALLQASYSDPIWEAQANLCFSCGGCNLVCGTCACFDVQDQLNWDLREGTRSRVCDACMVRGFMQVAGGHDFQSQRGMRYRHRFFRKGSYIPERFGFVACTGCGRCTSACVSDIANPVKLYNTLLERHPEVFAHRAEEPAPTQAQETKAPTSVFTLYPTKGWVSKKEGERRDIYLPELATLVRSNPITPTETFYQFSLDSGRALGHEPGQFVMISVMGYGEAPFSITSPPRDDDTFDMVIRKVGTVTTALANLQRGDKVGVRGPFGTAFPVYDELLHKDLVIVAGGLGIVPVRSVILYVLSHREDFGRLTIAYGMRTPSERLFVDDLRRFRREPGVTLLETVDRTEGRWTGSVGPVTTVLPEIGPVTSNTRAIVCGPPVMYRFVLSDLLAMGMPEDHIFLSLERRMKCGLGKCGHCQIHGLYACQDGPVLKYSQLVGLQEAL